MRPDTPPDESNVLEKVETALKQAVRQNPDLSWEYGTRIKRQKYVYLAVEHFARGENELPVTYSWYKFGAVMPAAPQTGTIGPVSTQMPTPGARESEVFTVPFDELVAFFADELSAPPLDEEHWYAGDLDFLAEFYERHAPEEYRELYLGNVELRQQLADAIDRLEQQHRRSESQIPTGTSVLTVEEYEKVGRAAARMHLGISASDQLRETLPEVRRFTNLVEDAFLMLSKTDSDQITDEQVSAIKTLEETYSEWVWEYPALLISKVTATGPNASTLRKWSAQKHFSVEDHLSREIDSAADLCAASRLVPSSEDYPDHSDAIDTAAKGITLSAMRRDD